MGHIQRPSVVSLDMRCCSLSSQREICLVRVRVRFCPCTQALRFCFGTNSERAWQEKMNNNSNKETISEHK